MLSFINICSGGIYQGVYVLGDKCPSGKVSGWYVSRAGDIIYVLGVSVWGGGGNVLEPLYLKESINSPAYNAKQYLETITLGFFHHKIHNWK